MSSRSTPPRGRIIRVTRNGPCLVSAGIPLLRTAILINRRGDAYAWRTGRKRCPKNGYALCRCGESRSKPFCDGAHVPARFKGTETAGRKSFARLARTIRGPKLALSDAPELCASARFCLRGKGVWFLTRRSRDSRARRMAIEEACLCPAGRLVVREPGGEPLEPELEPSIGLVEDPEAGGFGPLWVRGGIPVVSARGFVYEARNRVTLCRCGQSSNKPFCDGSHLHGH